MWGQRGHRARGHWPHCPLGTAGPWVTVLVTAPRLAWRVPPPGMASLGAPTGCGTGGGGVPLWQDSRPLPTALAPHPGALPGMCIPKHESHWGSMCHPGQLLARGDTWGMSPHRVQPLPNTLLAPPCNPQLQAECPPRECDPRGSGTLNGGIPCVPPPALCPHSPACVPHVPPSPAASSPRWQLPADALAKINVFSHRACAALARFWGAPRVIPERGSPHWVWGGSRTGTMPPHQPCGTPLG